MVITWVLNKAAVRTRIYYLNPIPTVTATLPLPLLSVHHGPTSTCDGSGSPQLTLSICPRVIPFQKVAQPSSPAVLEEEDASIRVVSLGSGHVAGTRGSLSQHLR